MRSPYWNRTGNRTGGQTKASRKDKKQRENRHKGTTEVNRYSTSDEQWMGTGKMHHPRKQSIHSKKRLTTCIFPSLAGMSLTKSPWTEIIKLFPSRETVVSDIPAWGRENGKPFFYSVRNQGEEPLDFDELQQLTVKNKVQKGNNMDRQQMGQVTTQAGSNEIRRIKGDRQHQGGKTTEGESYL